MRGQERRFLRRRLQARLAESRNRERILEALRASEARLREAQALARVGSWELDLASGRLTWSDEVFVIFEIDSSRFPASYEAFLAAIHPDDRELVDRAYKRSVQTRKPYAIDHRLMMADGRIKHVHERGMTEYDATGRPLRSLGTVQDVTERHQTERLLAEKSEQLTERVKELRCINQVHEILARGIGDIPALIRDIAAAIPPAWMYPEIAVARVQLFGEVYATAHCPAPAASQVQEIAVHGSVVGRVEVCYCEQRAERDEGPFLREERDLIRLIAGKIGFAVERLRENDRFRRLLESAPDAMVIVDREGCIVLINAQAEHMFGYPRSELIGQSIETLVPAHLVKAHQQHRRRYQEHATTRRMGTHLRLTARRRDGTEFPAEISLGPLDAADGALVCAAVRDITERRRAEAVLQRLSRMRATMSAINAMIVRVQDRDELLDSACRIAVERGGLRLAWIGERKPDGGVRPVAQYGLDGGYLKGLCVSTDAADPLGRGPTGTALREDRAVIVNDIAAAEQMRPWQAAAAARGFKASASLPLHLNGEVAGVLNLYAGESGFFDDDEIALLKELVSDISFAMETIEQRRRLDYLAYYDPLTQLANRALFTDRLSQFMVAAEGGGYQLALMVLDIERFKSLNDALGTAAGDTLLRTIARRLQIAAGAAERVARIGGDRFALIVPRVTRTSELIALLKGRIGTGIGEAVTLAEESYHPTARIGIALFPDDGTHADTLFHNAEAALKRAKISRDRYLFYTQAMNDSVRERLSLEGRVHHAVRQSELQLYYQPKVDLRSGRIAGVEALLRWPNHKGSTVACGRLIEILEDTGEIVEVGRWVVEQALRDRQSWRGAGTRPPPIAVNVSMHQLQNPAFVDEVAQALRSVPDSGDADAPVMEFELTESTLMQDIESSAKKLQSLRELGVPIAIDDFGSGYSSLSYLARLPISVLKVDQSFVRPMLDEGRAAKIVVAIISMARSLALKVVAEGVETAEQLAFLQAQGCDEVQGFLFSPAVPAAEIGRLLRADRRLTPPP